MRQTLIRVGTLLMLLCVVIGCHVRSLVIQQYPEIGRTDHSLRVNSNLKRGDILEFRQSDREAGDQKDVYIVFGKTDPCGGAGYFTVPYGKIFRCKVKSYNGYFTYTATEVNPYPPGTNAPGNYSQVHFNTKPPKSCAPACNQIIVQPVQIGGNAPSDGRTTNGDGIQLVGCDTDTGTPIVNPIVIRQNQAIWWYPQDGYVVNLPLVDLTGSDVCNYNGTTGKYKYLFNQEQVCTANGTPNTPGSAYKYAVNLTSCVDGRGKTHQGVGSLTVRP
jgi:hypothetical protein